MLSKQNLALKRSFDILFSLCGLIAIWWLIIIAYLVAAFETKSNGFFVQKRVGKDGELFNIYKIKTMKKNQHIATTITTSNDTRITKSGAIFRKLKIDELPQLVNILLGEMSFVGPRPDVAGYADKLEGSDRIILTIRPGITSPATLKYKNEEELLAKQKDPKRYNDEIIWPDKVKINKDYISNWSFKKDLFYIWQTIKGS